MCDETFEVVESQKDSRKTCGNNSCESKYRSKIMSGENNHQWNGGKVKIKCINCSDTRKVKKCYEDFYLTCGKRECKNAWRSLEMKINNPMDNKNNREKVSKSKIGKKNPNWKDDVAYKYGPNWDKQRNKTIKSDNEECVGCGMGREEHKEKYNKDLTVDHIKPRVEFIENDSFDWENANKLENLRTLCLSCHIKLEHKKGD